MQTFLPYPDFQKSAKCLDKKRCFKQLVEAGQILNTLTGKSKGWHNHPAVKIWRGYERCLAEYREVFYEENRSRGIKFNLLKPLDLSEFPDKIEVPPWLGDENFHASHRSNLLRKNEVYYGQFGWIETDDLPYVWPVK